MICFSSFFKRFTFLLFLFMGLELQAKTMYEYAQAQLTLLQERQRVLQDRLRNTNLSVPDRGQITGELNRTLAADIASMREVMRVQNGHQAAPSEAANILTANIATWRLALQTNDFAQRNSPEELRRLGTGFMSGLQSETAKINSDIGRLQAELNAANQQAANPQAAQQSGPSGPLTDECETLVVKCETETAEAKSQCDVDDNTNVRNAQSSLSQVGNTTTQMANMAAQANTSTQSSADGPNNGLASSCNMMANVAAGVNGAIGGYRMLCSDAFDSCKSSCSEIKTRLLRDRSAITSRTPLTNSCATNEASITSALRRVDGEQTQCNRLSGRASEATTGMQSAAANLLSGATRCIENTVPGGVDAYCQANPEAAVCAGLAQNRGINCDDGSPAAAASKVCICRKNPFASQCRDEVAQNRAAPSGLIGGAPLSGGATGPADFGAGIDGQNPIEANLTPGQEVGGRKMTLPGVGAGDGLQAGDGGGAGGRAPFDPFNGPKIFGRTGGGGTGQNPWGSRKAGGGTGTGVYGRFNRGMPDGTLKDFLPNGPQDPSRGLAGSMGGIMGPNVNIWEKINNRYVDHSLTKQSLLPSNYQATPQELQQRKPGN